MRTGFLGVACAAAVAVAAAGPAFAQDAEAPASTQVGDLTVQGGHMMGWFGSVDGLGGEVAFTVDNNGSEADRVLSVQTPAGPVGRVSIQTLVGGQVLILPAGETTLPAAAPNDPSAGLSRVTATLSDLASGRAMSQATTVTVTFERAGTVTISADPVSPAPPLPSARPR